MFLVLDFLPHYLLFGRGFYNNNQSRVGAYEKIRVCDAVFTVLLMGLSHDAERERELRREGGKSLLAYVRGVDPYLK